LRRGRYPDIPGQPEAGSPCWSFTSEWLYFDADWNVKFPYGTSLCLRVGRSEQLGHAGAPGFTLDVNAPLGEPNRLYLWLPGWSAIVSLPQLRRDVPTGEYLRDVPIFREVAVWPPHLPDEKLVTVSKTPEKKAHEQLAGKVSEKGAAGG
jgi:hypothetical protein